MKSLKGLKDLLTRKKKGTETTPETVTVPETIATTAPKAETMLDRAEFIIEQIKKEEKEGVSFFDELSPKMQELLRISYNKNPERKNLSEIKRDMREIITDLTLYDMLHCLASGPPNPFLEE